ncbi:PREDICTED: neuronal PAS domain-containing protein 4 isoform X2 [Nicrophorus vespilloides]|uniref:Neuronal PAS domain-containing protein 4 isoform X2 n=1 Tax=Nicrophorus vespilloides TaxID=110193 RepID=A0ABM1MYB3_NICVS|nr:PREDICTED: neuronal PAS domain-containing protein 4 isoform X2 [Nicrophorus vespilloides]
MFTRFDANKSTKGASKLRRDLINAEIANLRELLPLPPSTRQRLSQLQLMALVCVYVRKANYFQQAFKCHDVAGLHQPPTPNIGFSKAMSGFLMMMTQNGKLLYISDNAAEYLGHSMEDLLIHGDSVYDIIDKQDHQAIQCELGRPVNSGNGGGGGEEVRLFLCRMNVSRNARRQMRFGDQKVVLVQGRYLSFLPLCSRNEPVFLATCTPVAMPETRECVVQGATNVFTSIHSMDMRFIHIDNNGEFYLGFSREDLQGVSWYRLLHWECTREAQTKHRLITQSEQERSCILLAQFQRRSGDWIWMHCVLQVKESSESNQQPVIVCTNQVLSEAEALVMKTNSWLYHYYSVQNKLQYGLAYDVGPPTRLLYYPEHPQGTDFGTSHEASAYTHLSSMPTTHNITHLTHHTGPTQAHHGQHHHHHRRAGDSEPVDYSYSKRKPKDLQNLELEVTDVETSADMNGGRGSGSGGGLLVVSHMTERPPRTLLKIDPSDLMDQWNPSPPWSDTLQKVPDLCHQELSPYIGSAPPTPTATPSTHHAGSAFSFDWMPEQYVPTLSAANILAPVEDVDRQNYWPSTEHRLFPLQPPPKRNQPPPGRSESADRDTP